MSLRRRGAWALLAVLALSGCAPALAPPTEPALPAFVRPVSRGGRLTAELPLTPTFAEALPLLGFDRAAALGYDGAGVRVLVIDFFGRETSWGTAHGWAVLETLMTVAPAADYWRIDLDEVAAEIVLDGREPRDPVLRALQGARSWGRAGGEVINLSLGYLPQFGCSSGNVYSAAIVEALRALVGLGVNLVASAGNWGRAEPLFPACLPEVLAVGGIYDADAPVVRWLPDAEAGFPGCTDAPARRGAITCNSHHGEIYAVGAFATGYARYRGEEPFTGTSLAAPFVSGALALLRQAGLDAPAARARLLAGAVQARDEGFSFRRLDAAAALAGGAGPAEDHPARFADLDEDGYVSDQEVQAALVAWIQDGTLGGVLVTDTRIQAAIEAWVLGLPV